jgi:hypothetical protein
MVHAIQAVAGIQALPAPVHAFFASNAKVQETQPFPEISDKCAIHKMYVDIGRPGCKEIWTRHPNGRIVALQYMTRSAVPPGLHGLAAADAPPIGQACNALLRLGGMAA